MEGGPSCFPQGFTCLVVLWILQPSQDFAYGIFTLSDPLSQNGSLSLKVPFCSPQPRGARTTVWAPSISLAATLEIEVPSFFSSGYLDVSVPPVPFHTLWIGVWITELSSAGFSPFGHLTVQWIFAPPRSFSQLITSFIGSQCQGQSTLPLLLLDLFTVPAAL